MKILLFIFLASLMGHANSLDLPARVYRADLRTPNEIFRNGFRPRTGISDNIEDHMRDGMGLWQTRWISTTQSQSAAERGINDRAFHSLRSDDVLEAEPIWIYTMRPTNNMYSFSAALAYYSQESHNPDADARHRYSRLLRALGWQEEWGALDRIEGNQIVNAVSYRWDRIVHQYVRTDLVIQNEHYIATAPAANSGIYHIGGSARRADVVYQETRRPHFSLLSSLAFCMCALARDGHRNTRAVDPDLCSITACSHPAPVALISPLAPTLLLILHG